MATEVEYRELSTLEQGDPKKRCQYLMENKMQCPTHGWVVVSPEEYLCMYHFNLIKMVKGADFKFVPAEPEPEAA